MYGMVPRKNDWFLERRAEEGEERGGHVVYLALRSPCGPLRCEAQETHLRFIFKLRLRKSQVPLSPRPHPLLS